MIPYENPILDALAASEFEFIPIGSRYIGYNTEHSDWDFMCGVNYSGKDFEKLSTYLRELGFVRDVKLSPGYGADRDMTALFRADGSPAIEVQIFNKEDVTARRETYRELRRMYDRAPSGVKALCQAVKGKGSAWYVLHSLVRNLSVGKHP